MTAAQVIIYVISAFSTLWTLGSIVMGIVGLVSGASIAAGPRVSGASSLAPAFGGLIGAFLGLAVVWGLFSLAVIGLWVWSAVALGRASAVARGILTVLCGFPVVILIVLQLVAAGEGSGSSTIWVLGAAACVPGSIIILLWAPTSSRSYFAPHRVAPPKPRPAVPVARHGAEPVTTPIRRPALCTRCSTAIVPGGAFCGGCGAPTAGVGPHIIRNSRRAGAAG